MTATGSTRETPTGHMAIVKFGVHPCNYYIETPCYYSTALQARSVGEMAAQAMWGWGVVWE